MVDCVVIGAGISGAATAYHLATEGVGVILVDRYRPAAMASGWTLAGVRQSGRDPAELPLAKAAVAEWASLAEALDAPTDYRREGNLRLARNEAELAQIAGMVETQRGAGLEVELLDQAALRKLAPAVSPAVLGASYCPTDGHADPHKTVEAFVAAAERAGAETRFGERVLSIDVEAGRVVGVTTDRGPIPAARVVLTGGVFGNELLEPIGLHVPMSIRTVTVIRTAPVAPVLAQVIGVASADCAGRQEVGGRFRFTSGGSEWSGAMLHEPVPRVFPPTGHVVATVTRFGGVVPAVLEAGLDEVWAGLIDGTPDALPVLQAPGGPDGLVIGMGFSGHGFCLGPVTGRILAALAQDREPDLPIAPFRLERFRRNDRGAPLTLNG